MGRYNGILVLLLLWFLTLAIPKSSPTMICREKERKALLSFKQGLDDPLNQLPSWTGLDCCMWEGVGCNNMTGRVVQLNLTWLGLSGEVSDSLLSLKHLHSMDLSSNDFGGHIPKFFGSLASLRYLDLSGAGFSGVIPHQLGNLSSLHHLNIQSDLLNVEDLGWISNLSHLEFLGMSGIDLSKEPNWLQVMNTLPSLSELHLSECQINSHAPLPRVNFSSLVVLDLSWNNIDFSKFEWFSSLSSLVKLDLSHDNFHGPMPITLRNMTSLRFLDLTENKIDSTMPEWLYDLTSLESLFLPFNNFQGKLSITLGNLTSLTELDLSYNGLQGEIPRSLGDLRNLQALYVSHNQLNGTIPESFGRLLELEELDLSYNQLYGTIPNSLGHLLKLTVLEISYNFFEGVLSEVHLANLTRLKTLSASSSKLSLQVSSNWFPSFQLEIIGMGSWQLGPRFPTWLRTQKDCWFLDFSNAKISDVIPTWFWNLDLYHLNLSHNQIRGNIQSITFGTSIFLGSNNLSGPLPQVSSGVFDLDLSNNSFTGSLSPTFCARLDEEKMLNFLDLSTNLLSKEIPNCWKNWRHLKVLKLGNNNLTGNIPSSMGSMQQLISLNLRNNSLSGNIPLSLQNCSQLMILDLSDNEFSGTIPMWMGKSMVALVVLALRSNKFGGSIPQELCKINSLQIFDLANNNLSGTIPPCLRNFSAMTKQRNSSDRTSYISYGILGGEFMETAMLVTKGMEYEYGNTLGLVTNIDLSSNSLSGGIPEELASFFGLLSLNLSKNYLHGKIPKKIGTMKSLESLDLSMNQLSGVIPQSMANLTFLGYLNLSYNKFSGQIPSGTQLQSFSPFSFIGNHELCGPPLTDHCVGNDAPPHQTPKANEENDGDHGWIDMKWFYVGIPLGFVVGFWGVCGPLAFNKAWRYAYFRFLDDMECKLWVLFFKCKCR